MNFVIALRLLSGRGGADAWMMGSPSDGMIVKRDCCWNELKAEAGSPGRLLVGFAFGEGCRPCSDRSSLWLAGVL